MNDKKKWEIIYSERAVQILLQAILEIRRGDSAKAKSIAYQAVIDWDEVRG